MMFYMDIYQFVVFKIFAMHCNMASDQQAFLLISSHDKILVLDILYI